MKLKLILFCFIMIFAIRASPVSDGYADGDVRLVRLKREHQSKATYIPMVALYEHFGLKGSCIQIWRPGMSDLSRANFDNRASSFMFACDHCKVMLYQGPNFTGPYIEMHRRSAQWDNFPREWSDRVSSVKVHGA